MAARESKERQTSFATGELAPGFWGRTDRPEYQGGARGLLNFYVSPHGSLLNRPGSQHLTQVQGGGESLLIPFIYDDTDACAIVLTEQFITVYDTDGTVLWSADHLTLGGDYLYATSDFDGLRWDQVGNVVVLVHPSHPPRELRRLTSDGLSWSLGEMDFTVPAYDAAVAGTPRMLTRGWERLVDGSLDGDWDSGTHPLKKWTYQVTAVMEDDHGKTWETMPETVTEAYVPTGADDYTTWGFGVTAGDIVIIRGSPHVYRARIDIPSAPRPDTSDSDFYWEDLGIGDSLPRTTWDIGKSIVVWPDKPVVIAFCDAVADASGARVIRRRVYRGRDGEFGLLGETKSNYFVDDGDIPDKAFPPPQGVNPFIVLDGAEVPTGEMEYPAVVAHWGDRRVFAGSTRNPARIRASAISDYDNFDDIRPPKATDAMFFDLAGKTAQAVRALVSHRTMLALTSGAEWAVAAQGGVLVPGAVATVEGSKHGSGELAPLELANSVVFVQSKGTVPRELQFSNEGGGFVAHDLSQLARHLFVGHTLVSSAYCEDPHGVMWFARDDGVLLSCTYLREHNMLAWCRHEIEDGLVERCVSLPVGQEDVLFLIVNRSGNRYLERLASRVVTDIREGCFLDGSVGFDGRNTTAETVTLTDLGPGGGEGEVVQVDFSSLTSIDAEGLEVEGVQLEVVAYSGGSTWTMRVLPGNTVTTFATATTDWSLLRSAVTMPAHSFNGGVTALCDGNVVTLNAKAGTAALGGFYKVVHVGLGYNSDFESLDSVAAREAQRTVKKTLVEYNGSRGGSVGMDFDTLHELPSRDVGDDYEAAAMRYGAESVLMVGEWTRTGKVCVRQDQPLPFEVLAITRIVEVGG